MDGEIGQWCFESHLRTKELLKRLELLGFDYSFIGQCPVGVHIPSISKQFNDYYSLYNFLDGWESAKKLRSQ